MIISSLKNNEEIVETLTERIIGRVCLHDIYHPNNDQLIVASGNEITEHIAADIEFAGIESVEIRSALTCETKRGLCGKCYGRSLACGFYQILNKFLG